MLKQQIQIKAIYFWSLMSCSINNIKSHIYSHVKIFRNFMFSDLTWKKNLYSWPKSNVKFMLIQRRTGNCGRRWTFFVRLSDIFAANILPHLYLSLIGLLKNTSRNHVLQKHLTRWFCKICRQLAFLCSAIR